jgi:hypothetical protein
MSSIPPFDLNEGAMFFERLWTRANKPAVILADDVEAVAIERTLDPRP